MLPCREKSTACKFHQLTYLSELELILTEIIILNQLILYTSSKLRLTPLLDLSLMSRKKHRVRNHGSYLQQYTNDQIELDPTFIFHWSTCKKCKCDKALQINRLSKMVVICSTQMIKKCSGYLTIYEIFQRKISLLCHSIPRLVICY